MKRKTMAIVDGEHGYAYYFMEHFNQQGDFPFEMIAFTGKDVFVEYTNKNKVDLLLISEKLMEMGLEDLVEGKVILLSEGNIPKAFKNYESVYKYQSSEALIREVLTIYGKETKNLDSVIFSGKSSFLMGVYSPLARVRKTSFALVAGQILAEEKSTLYVNLETYSGFEDIFQENYEHTFDELLYYAKDRDTSFIYRLKSMVYHLGKLDYIAPAKNPKDFFSMNYGEWKDFFELLQSQGNYRIIIIDFGEGLEDLFHLLGLCDAIYMPVKDDKISRGKILQFENLMRMWDGIPILEKIKKISLPKEGEEKDSACLIEELLWGEFGSYVREVLRKEEMHG